MKDEIKELVHEMMMLIAKTDASLKYGCQMCDARIDAVMIDDTVKREELKQAIKPIVKMVAQSQDAADAFIFELDNYFING